MNFQFLFFVSFQGKACRKPKGCFPTFMHGIPNKPVGVD